MEGLIMEYELNVPAILRRGEQLFGDKEIVTRESFEFVDEITKAAVGKFRKTTLRETFATAQPAETA